MTKERLEEILNNVLDWGAEHEEEFRECLIDAMDLTEEEIKELRLEDYITEEDDEDTDEEDEEDEYNEAHAKEWIEKHPHGWYNNENDYGEDIDEEEE